MQQSETVQHLAAFLRVVAVLSPNTTSLRCRSVGFFLPFASAVVGRPVTEAEFCAAAAHVPRLKVAPTGTTNIIAGKTLRRAVDAYPAVFRVEDRRVAIIGQDDGHGGES
jgi:hypothetical protein